MRGRRKMLSLYCSILWVLVFISSSLQTPGPWPDCRDAERAAPWWPGLVDRGAEDEPTAATPFRLQVRSSGEFNEAYCGLQFNVYLWSEENGQTITHFIVQALTTSSGGPTGHFMSEAATTWRALNCMHKQDTAIDSTGYSPSNHVEMKWESSCDGETSVLWRFAVMDSGGGVYTSSQEENLIGDFGEFKSHDKLRGKRQEPAHCMTSESNSTRNGSCVLAGYNSCCNSTSGNCSGDLPSNSSGTMSADCFCDANCRMYGDCCSDVSSDCATSNLDPYLLITDDSHIHALSLDGDRVGNVIMQQSAWIVDFHYEQGLMFWSESSGLAIWRTSLDGSSEPVRILDYESAVSTSGSCSNPSVGELTFGFAVDWVGDKVYWTNYCHLKIEVMDLSGDNIATLLDLEFQPLAMALDPIMNRTMYWFERNGAERRISTASMDGSNNSSALVSVNFDVYWMALDHSAKVLYMTNFHSLWSVSTDTGTGLMPRSSLDARGISVFGDLLYISDSSDISPSSGGDIRRVNTRAANFDLEDVPVTFCVLNNAPNGITVVAPQMDAQVENPCSNDNGNCIHLCLLGSSGSSCKCRDLDSLNPVSNQQDCRWPLEAPRAINLNTNSSENTIEGDTVQVLCESQGNPPPNIWWVNQPPDMQGSFELINYNMLLNQRQVSIVTVSVFSDFQPPKTVSTLTISNIIPAPEISHCYSENVFGSYGFDGITTNVSERNDCQSEMAPDCTFGTCVDLSAGYLCQCLPGFAGHSCNMDEPLSPPQSISISGGGDARLGDPLNLTCTADDNSDTSLLRFQWYKDRELLGERQSYLYLQEVLPRDRGEYVCEVTVRNQIIQTAPLLVTLPGVHQFLIIRPLNKTTEDYEYWKIQEPEYDFTIYSITVFSDANPRYIVMTVFSEETDTVLISEAIRETFSPESVQISRHDGCAAESTTSIVSGTEVVYQWPETAIGDTATLPCSESSGSAERVCGGNYSQGASWMEADDCQCRLSVENTNTASGVTLQLCQINNLNVTEMAKVTAELSANTSALASTDVTSIASVLETLVDSAANNEEVRDDVFETIDNLQLADPEVLEMSQSSGNTSDRLRESIIAIQRTANISTNETIVFTGNAFAVQVRRVDCGGYAGDVFNVILGKIEDAMDTSNEIKPEDLKTLMEVVDNATASISTASLFDQPDKCSASSETQIGYSVFRTSALFPNSDNDTVTSIIIGITVTDPQASDDDNTTDSMTNSPEADDDADLIISFETSMDKPSACAAYETKGGFGKWSSDNCREVKKTDTRVECVCKKITHFGLILDLNPGDTLSPLALEIITYIGLVVSLVSLFFFIGLALPVIPTRWKRRLKDRRTQYNSLMIVLNMSLSLIGLYVCFLIAGHSVSNKVACGIFSALLQYFFLAFFGWTSAYAMYLFFLTVTWMSESSYTRGYILRASLIVWLVPMLIVAVSGGAGYEYYTNAFFCRPTEYPFWFGMILPFVATQILNWFLFVWIMGYLTEAKCAKRKSNVTNCKDIKKDVKVQVQLAILMSVSFGLGWGIGLLATGLDLEDAEEATFAIQVIFAIFVGLQGVLVMLFGLRDRGIREYWLGKFCRKKKSHYQNTSDTSQNKGGKRGVFDTLSRSPGGATTITNVSTAVGESAIYSSIAESPAEATTHFYETSGGGPDTDRYSEPDIGKRLPSDAGYVKMNPAGAKWVGPNASRKPAYVNTGQTVNPPDPSAAAREPAGAKWVGPNASRKPAYVNTGQTVNPPDPSAAAREPAGAMWIGPNASRKPAYVNTGQTVNPPDESAAREPTYASVDSVTEPHYASPRPASLDDLDISTDNVEYGLDPHYASPRDVVLNNADISTDSVDSAPPEPHYATPRPVLLDSRDESTESTQNSHVRTHDAEHSSTASAPSVAGSKPNYCNVVVAEPGSSVDLPAGKKSKYVNVETLSPEKKPNYENVDELSSTRHPEGPVYEDLDEAAAGPPTPDRPAFHRPPLPLPRGPPLRKWPPPPRDDSHQPHHI